MQEYKGYTININQDINAENPVHEWDFLGTFSLHHKNYLLGSKDDPFKNDTDALHGYLKSGKAIFLPIYMYDHSGLSISTNRNYPFNCPWDSGQLGYIFVDKSKVRKEYKCKRITKKILNKVLDCLQSEVNTYNQYLSGEVYFYSIEDEQGEIIDSLCGLYGYDYALEEAKSYIDWHIKEEKKKHFQQLKTWIKNHVPLDYRQAYSY